jgi:hypothetical protein
VQAVDTELCVSEFEFAGHAEQLIVAADAEYVPASQAVHKAEPVTSL